MDPDRPTPLGLPRELPGPGRILVVAARLNPPPGLADLLHSVLSPAERARGERLRIPQVRRRYLATRGWIRWILSGLEATPPGALRFMAGPQGKPFLQPGEKGVAFNLAHTGDHLVVAVAREGQIGVDAEEPRALGDLEGLARQVFTSEELDELHGYAEGPARRAAFLRGWTRKEALLKAMGGGLSLPLQDATMDLGDAPLEDPAAPPRQRLRSLTGGLHSMRGPPWVVADLSRAAPLEGAAAVAWDRPLEGVQVVFVPMDPNPGVVAP